MPPTFEMLLQYFSRHLRAGHLVVAVNKFNFLLIPIFTCVIMHLVYLPASPPTNFAEPFCSISLGTTVIPRRNWKQWLWKNWGREVFFFGGGGGKEGRATRCIVVYVRMANRLLRTFSFLKGVYK